MKMALDARQSWNMSPVQSTCKQQRFFDVRVPVLDVVPAAPVGDLLDVVDSVEMRDGLQIVLACFDRPLRIRRQQRQQRAQIVIVPLAECFPQRRRVWQGRSVSTFVVGDEEADRRAEVLREAPGILLVNDVEKRADGGRIEQIRAHATFRGIHRRVDKQPPLARWGRPGKRA